MLNVFECKKEAAKLIDGMKKHRLVFQSKVDYMPFPFQPSSKIRLCYYSVINGEEALKNPDLYFLPGAPGFSLWR